MVRKNEVDPSACCVSSELLELDAERREKEKCVGQRRRQQEASTAAAVSSSGCVLSLPPQACFYFSIAVDSKPRCHVHASRLAPLGPSTSMCVIAIQDAVGLGEVRLEWVATLDRLADMFTKPLGRQLLYR
jgi:hypothetical protein